LIVDTEEPTEYSPERVYPNPTSDFLQLGSSGQATVFKAFTIDGRAVLSLPIDVSGRVDVRSLASGLYFYKVLEPGKRRRTGKFVRR
jgi:hypothetical protein